MMLPKVEYLRGFALDYRLPNDVVKILWENISFARENPVSQSEVLAGNISSSLKLEDTDNWFFDNVCIPKIIEFKEIFKSGGGHFNQAIFNNDVPYIMNSFWVNFQKQHEFNPLHNHTGLFSFVIFMKIPYDYREQRMIPHVKISNTPCAGDFVFVHVDLMGKICSYSYPLDPSCEGIMILFPAEMNHQVYPFYNCEEERITISGNIVYDRQRA